MKITKKYLDKHIQDFDPSYEYWNDKEIEKKKSLYYNIKALERSQEQQFFIKEINQLIGEDFENINNFLSVCCGNILEYETNIKFDLIYLSKAFHHIESPIVLLRKLKKLLSNNGKIIICGEHYYSPFKYTKQLFKHFIKYAIIKKYRKIRSFFTEYGMLFPYSLEKGDIHYSLYNYHYFLEKNGI